MTANAQPCPAWDVAADFRVAPNQENPSRDRCGNGNVWHYLESDPSTFPAHVPSTYSPLNEFITDAFFIAGLQQWQGNVISSSSRDKLSAVGINSTASTKTFGGIVWGPGVVRVHPFSDRLAIVGWRSPIDGTVNLTGAVSDLDGTCGNGISWSIDKFNGSQNTTLAFGGFLNGGHQNFQDGAGGASLAAVSVSVGDFIYVVVDPASNEHRCDSTGLAFTVQPIGAVPLMSPAPLLLLVLALLYVAVSALRPTAG